jgi:hypothetical protein
MKALSVLISATALPAAVLAQGFPGDPGAGPFDSVTAFVLAPTAGQFFVAVLSGIILAYCFQWLLTNLSLAAGISALQGLTDPGKREAARRKAEEKAEREESKTREPGLHRQTRREAWDAKAIKFESGAGLWAMITSAVALFLACWLALELIGFPGKAQGAILGLVIWAVFMGTMLLLESAAATSLLGYVTGMAREGVSAMLKPLKGASDYLARNRELSAERENAVRTAGEISATVRRELFGEEEEEPGITDRIRSFVDANIKPKALDAKKAAQDMRSVLADPELLDLAKRGELKNLDRERFAEIVASRTDLDKRQAERLVDSLHTTWGEFILENSPALADTVTDAQAAKADVAGTAGPSQGAGDRYSHFEQFLSSSPRSDLQPEKLELEVKTLVRDPGTGRESVRESLGEFDRERLVRLLMRRQDLSQEEAGRVADQIDLARSRAFSAREQAEHRAEEVRDRALSKVRDQVYSMAGPDLDYEGFAGDFRKLFEDPRAGYESLKNRLKGIDRETILSILTKGRGMDRGTAEALVEKGEALKAKAEGKVDAARDETRSGMERVADRAVEAKEAVLERARQVEEETKRRLEEAKRISLEQAESTRKVTATAAWWLLGIAVVSGAAAALGGILGAGA